MFLSRPSRYYVQTVRVCTLQRRSPVRPMQKFFIVGCPRSGTTMVQQALNRHSRIAIPPETKFFFSFYGHSHKQQLRHLERLDADLQISLPRPAMPIRSPDEARAFYEDMARRYVARLGKNDVDYFGEKTPEHTGHLPMIRQVFPEAKILVLYRDGRDVASSLHKMPWASSDLYVNFMIWLYYHQIVQHARASEWPGMYFARYEDIVADPAAAFGDILSFLELPYEPAVAAGCGNREGVPVREYAWKGRALQKITTERVGVFQNELSRDQIEILERLGRHALPSLGYRLITEHPAPLSVPLLLKLSFEMSKFVYRLPWQSVAKELLCRSFLRDANGQLRTPFRSPEPLVSAARHAPLEQAGFPA
jgi:hypothetical protein